LEWEHKKCLKDERIIKIIEPLFSFDDSRTLKEKLEYIINEERTSDIAIEFIAQTTRLMEEQDESLDELSEDRIGKKRKKIYQ